ncbi:MAG: nuclear transport factor 2 family protein [Acidobacteriota bacterium]
MTKQWVVSFRRHLLLPGLVFGAILATSSTSQAQLPMESNAQQSAGQMAQQVGDLQKVADRWDEAVYQHDQYALELVLAPQFINISDTGDVSNRDQQISEMMMKDALRYQLTQKVVSVRLVGDVAVANGTYERVFQGSKLSRTKTKTERGVFSQVYVRARNTWECINSQRTIIQQPVVKGKKKSQSDTPEKPLNHDLGFHFPGMHHNSDAGSTSGSPSTAGSSTTSSTSPASNSTAPPQE